MVRILAWAGTGSAISLGLSFFVVFAVPERPMDHDNFSSFAFIMLMTGASIGASIASHSNMQIEFREIRRQIELYRISEPSRPTPSDSSTQVKSTRS
jgi:hypothetical protein